LDKETLRRRLYLCLVLNAAIVGGEFTVGALIHSVGLMSDAMHNLIDQGSLFLTLYAYLLSYRPATARSTFGYHRAGIVTALVNAVLLVLAALGLTIIAARRLAHPVFVPGGWVIAVALLSFAANMAIALLLQKAGKDDLNIRGAFWHMFGDAWVCFGVALSGVVILATHWTLIDPLISFVVVAAILKGVWPVLKEALEVLMEAAPRGINASHIADAIQSVPGVENVHDLHLWQIKPGLSMLTCHVGLPLEDRLPPFSLLKVIRSKVASEFGVKHMTIQLESGCCHPQAIHCDLENLLTRHKATSLL
jgi:cobalt-zinc-cadmium efflux system protein